jgi:hypothetical protein
MKAKLDTGAQTSALHAFALTIDDDADPPRARFEVHPRQRSAGGRVKVEHEITGFRRVRSSSGHSELRPLIRTPLQIGDLRYEIDLTLTARDEMGFRLLLGRSALRRRFLVDSARSYVQGAKPVKKAKR